MSILTFAQVYVHASVALIKSLNIETDIFFDTPRILMICSLTRILDSFKVPILINDCPNSNLTGPWKAKRKVFREFEGKVVGESHTLKFFLSMLRHQNYLSTIHSKILNISKRVSIQEAVILALCFGVESSLCKYSGTRKYSADGWDNRKGKHNKTKCFLRYNTFGSSEKVLLCVKLSW